MAAVEKPVPFQPNTMADDLQRSLRASLFTGAYEPGQPISIRQIAEKYKVSIMPARDALRSLVAEGVLIFRDSRTIVVPELDGERLRDIRFARDNLESELAYRACQNMGAEELLTLRAIDKQLDQAIAENDTDAYVQGNHAFHFYIYRRADSAVLHRLVETLWLQYAPSMRKVCAMYGASDIKHDFHRAATAALEANDRNGFRKAISDDIHQGMDFIAAARIPVA